MDITVQHDEANKCFFLEENGARAVLEYKVSGDGVWDFCHTWVSESMRGGGVAARLLQAGCEAALASGIKVLPSCSYADAYLRKHAAEFLDLKVEPVSRSSCRLGR